MKKEKEHSWGGYKSTDQLFATLFYGFPIIIFALPLLEVARESLGTRAFIEVGILFILLMLGWGLTLYNRDHILYLKQEQDKLKQEIEELKKNQSINKD